MPDHHLAEPGVVALERGFPGLLPSESRVGLGHLVQPTEDEVGLNPERLLAPEGAVVVEHGDPFDLRNSVRGHALHEVEHGGLGRAVVPGGERLAHAQRPDVSEASSFSTTWSIVKLAAFCRGGNSSKVARNCATRAAAARTM